MAEYIYRKGLNDRLKDFSKWCKDGRKEGVDFVLDCVLPNMPSADVVPRAELAVSSFKDTATILKKEIHDKAVYPNCHGVEPYISLKVFDAVINKVIGS